MAKAVAVADIWLLWSGRRSNADDAGRLDRLRCRINRTRARHSRRSRCRRLDRL